MLPFTILCILNHRGGYRQSAIVVDQSISGLKGLSKIKNSQLFILEQCHSCPEALHGIATWSYSFKWG